MPECPICVERKRMIAACPRCDVQGCRDCMARRAIENPLLPQCVGNCRGLSLGELQQTIGPALISKVFRPALKAALLAHERAQIPNTMAAVEAAKRQEAAKVELIALEAEYEERATLIRGLQREQNALDHRIWTARRSAQSASLGSVRTILRCQRAECLGYADHTGTCLVCGQGHCTQCGKDVAPVPTSELTGVPLDAAGPPHKCDPNEVESLKVIAQSAKPCPSCGAPTTRISGCPQMWCTYCRTGYRYDTLSISRGAVSNPHRDEYLRNGGQTNYREPGDIPCGGFAEPDYYARRAARDLMPRLDAIGQAQVPGYAETQDKCKGMLDLGGWRVRGRCPSRDLTASVTRSSGQLRARLNAGNTKLTEMRVQYILKRLSEDEYAAALVRLDTRRRRDSELVPVFVMYEEMLQDLDRRWVGFINRSPKMQAELTAATLPTATAAKFASEIHSFNMELLWVQQRVQDGLNTAAKHLGLKRLGRLSPEDGRLRLN